MIALNEASKIERTIKAAMRFTDDVVVADTGSTDQTVEIAKKAGAHVFSISWKGFGKSKNEALGLAEYSWVLFLDADEVPDETLSESLRHFTPKNTSDVYQVRFINYLGSSTLLHGEWNYAKIRLFNRLKTRWDESPVHEKLIRKDNSKLLNLPGAIHHYSLDDEAHYLRKTGAYAQLMAEKYFEAGKKSSWLRINIYPRLQYLRNFYLRGGYKDGKAGKTAAQMSARYAFLKYHHLRELWRTNLKKQQ